MINAFLKLRFRIFYILGLIPGSDTIEKKEKDIERDYNFFLEMQQSDELARYEELRNYFRSDEFKKKKKEINAPKYKNSEPYHKEKRFRKLRNSDPVKTYLKVSDSKDLHHYQKMKDSDALKRFYELKEFFDSEQFEEFKRSLKQKREKKKSEYKSTLSHYNKLRKQYGWFFKFRDSQSYADYLRLKDSDKVSQYYELQKKINNTEVKQLNKQGKEEKEQKLKEFKDLKNHFKRLKKDPEIKNFLKVNNSRKLKKFEALEGSDEIREFTELQERINSEEFQRLREEIEALKFENTEENRKYQEYRQLKKDRDVKKALRFGNSKKFAVYSLAVGSEILKEYQELKDYVKSNDFIEKKEYLKTRDKFRLSEEYEKFKEYKSLKKSDNIRWYYKNLNSKKIASHGKYERTFLEKFEGNEIDRNKWLTSYYWGKALLNENYVQANDAHFYTDGSNLNVKDGVLSIVTREEEAEGKVWHPHFGFYPGKFSYTSGIINTGQSFRQKYGLFRAKVKLGDARNLRHCFWLVPEKILPEVDIFHYSGKKLRKMEFASYLGDPKDTRNCKVKRGNIRGLKFDNRFFIFTLEWKPTQLIWKINGITVNKCKSNIPKEPMYMILNSGLNGDIDQDEFPKEMQVDWVEAYKERVNE